MHYNINELYLIIGLLTGTLLGGLTVFMFMFITKESNRDKVKPN